MKQLHHYLLSTICIVLVLAGCKKDDLQLNAPPPPAHSNGVKNKVTYSNEVATSWFDLELEIIKSKSMNPPMASRALGYTGVTLYESLVPGMDGFLSLQSKLGYNYTLPIIQPNTTYHWPAVANAALKTIISKILPAADPALINDRFINLKNGYIQEASAGTIALSEAYGESVANVIFEWSKTDGSTNSISYIPSNLAGSWQPTFPAFQQNPLLPNWGNNRPFISSSVSENCLPSAPIHKFSNTISSRFYKEALEVYETVNNLDDEQKAIANFWADGGGTITPPGHLVNIATQMIRNNNVDLQTAAIVYAKMGMAVTDAFIACWNGKYKYNLMRPITYIRQHIKEDWKSFIGTPPFPSYASGHSTVSGACAEILTEFFGNVRFTDETHKSTMGTRSFRNFSHAAEEAAVSRLYGGIHYRMDNEMGLQKGKLIGKNIAKLNLKK